MFGAEVWCQIRNVQGSRETGSMKMPAHRPEINPEMKENTDQKTLHSDLLVELQIHSSRSQIKEEGIFGILFS